MTSETHTVDEIVRIGIDNLLKDVDLRARTAAPPVIASDVMVRFAADILWAYRSPLLTTLFRSRDRFRDHLRGLVDDAWNGAIAEHYLPTPPIPPRPLADTAAVEDFMLVMGQTVRKVPTTLIPTEERLLRARLTLEEALEFVAAMGCDAYVVAPGAADGEVVVDSVRVSVRLNPEKTIDLVEASDAIADINVVNKGNGHTLGIDSDEAFRIVHATNMAKAPGGVVTLREDGKVLKPDGWVGPTEALRGMIASAIAGATPSS